MKYGRLLGVLNTKTVDAEISMGGPFLMVISLLSYINWLAAALFFSQNDLILTATGIVIIVTGVSLLAAGVGLLASDKPFKFRNLIWVPSIYVYWIIQMCIATSAFIKLLFRRKRVWSKTVKEGFVTPNMLT